jgi:gp157 family protein|nr:MAG TPA: resistance protein [Caudoviricetes sp.]
MNNLNVIKYEIKEINSIANFLNSENNELDQETINDTRESIKYLLEEKSEQLELILKEQDMKEEKCKEIADFYTKKAKYANEKKKMLKELILEAMQKLGTKKIETTTGTFTIRNNTPSLIIEDENLIPQRFITHISSTKIEKNEIKKEMKKGVEIPGVHLETTQSLLIK